MDLFKSITHGIKFDKDRFLKDARKLRMVRTVEPDMSRNNNEPRNKTRDYTKKTSQSRSNKLKIKAKIPKINSSGEEDDQLEQGNRVRKVKGVHIWGSDIPKPISNFQSIASTPYILDNLAELGYKDPTSIQQHAIPIILRGRELLASAPTGSGKTAAYLIPVIVLLKQTQSKCKGVRTLILSPTRVLAKQIYTECLGLTRNIGLTVSIIHSKNITEENIKKAWRSDFLVTTPNRLVCILKEAWVGLTSVEHLIIDECDNLFEDGFQDQIGFIYSACTSEKLRRYFFSATFGYNVEIFCKTHLDNHIVLSLGPKSTTVDLVDQTMTFVGTEAGKFMALMDLIRKGIEPPVLLFVQSEERAKELYSELFHNGVNCEAIYAAKSQTQQEKIIESFRLGKIWILISTGILSRGIDFPALKLVINYDLPASPVQYVHNVGRTGRAGRTGQCITFFTEEDHENLQRIAHVLQNTGLAVPGYLLKLKKSRPKEIKVPKREKISCRHLPTKRRYKVADKQSSLHVIKK